jgi:RNA polymerase sigma-70 factor (ECF subfamily)
MEMFSNCLKQSWNLAKNGIKTVDINTIYNKYYQQVYLFIRGRLNNVEVAEELTNDVFMRANKHIESYDVHVAKLNTWLLTIAKNLVIDFYRADKHGRNTVDASDFNNGDGIDTYQFLAEDHTDSLVNNGELQEKLESSFSFLKPNHRVFAELFFKQEKSYKEIAYILDVPLGTVKGMVSRCRAMLQTTLTPQVVMS